MLKSKAGGEFWHELTFTRADVLAEFPVRTEQDKSVIPRKITEAEDRRHCTSHPQVPTDEPTHPLLTLAGHHG